MARPAHLAGSPSGRQPARDPQQARPKAAGQGQDFFSPHFLTLKTRFLIFLSLGPRA